MRIQSVFGIEVTDPGLNIAASFGSGIALCAVGVWQLRIRPTENKVVGVACAIAGAFFVVSAMMDTA